MITILIGIVSSVAAEIVTAINKKLANTVLRGNAAFLLAFAVSVVGAFVKEVITPGFSWSVFLNYQELGATLTEIWTVSQIFFIFVTQKLDLDVQSEPTGTVAASVPKIVG